MATIQGNKNLIELPPVKTKWTRGAGDTIQRTWVGTAEQVIAYKNRLIATDRLVEDISTDLNSNPCRLVASWGGNGDNGSQQPQNEISEPQWDIITEEITKDLKEHPKFHLYSTSDKAIAEIDAYISDGSADKDLEKATRAYWTEKYPAMNMGTYFGLRMAGVTGYTMYAWTIRKTEVITRLTTYHLTLNPSPTCVDFSTIGLPSDIQLSPPSGWKWLALPPTLSKSGRKKQVTHEWRSGNFSPTLYAGGNKEPWEVTA